MHYPSSLPAAALLLALGLATATAQYAEPRCIEDRWKNCSQVVQGRIGALHDAPGESITSYFATIQNGSVTVHYSPCNYVAGQAYYLQVVDGTQSPTFDQIYDYVTGQYVSMSDTDRLLQFVMPVTSNAIPYIQMSYKNSTTQQTIQVTVNCNMTGIADNDTATVNSVNLTGGNMTLVLTSLAACPRFPYTNQTLPGGAIAALVVVLLCFAFEFSTCAWYHYHNKQTLSTEEEPMH